MRRELPDLAEFLSVTFHEDYDIGSYELGPDPSAEAIERQAIGRTLDGSSTQFIRSVLRDLDKLLAAAVALSPRQLEEIVCNQLGSSRIPGGPEWLAFLRRAVAERLPEP